MNKVILKGRLANDVELTTLESGVILAKSRIAVNRRFKKEGQPDTDFFNCSAFGKTAEFLEKYFVKGQEILVEGSIQNRSWEDSNGNKRYATDIIVNEVEFCGSKKDNESKQQDSPKDDGEYAAVEDEELPF